MSDYHQKGDKEKDPQKIIKRIEATKKTTNKKEPRNEETKLRVAAYCRVSTEQESQEGSYELQCKYYLKYINSRVDWTFVKIYSDEGKSGTSMKSRSGFQNMINDCENGLIDRIITKSISRFARNTMDCIETVRKLKSLPNPVGVYFEKENIDTLDSKSELILTILASIAQEESRSISENIRWALEKKYDSGDIQTPTCYLLGYKTVISSDGKTKKIVIDPKGAAVIKIIYKEFLSGKSLIAIAKNLEQLGARTAKKNKTWTPAAIKRILINEKYVGDAISCKNYTVDFLSHKNKPNTGEKPQILVENHHQAIIDRESWNAVQNLLAQRKMDYDPSSSRQTSGTSISVFSGRFFCHYCGSKFFRKTEKAHACGHIGAKYFLWKCRNADGRGNLECHAKAIPQITLEQSFMEMLMKLSKVPKKELDRRFYEENNIPIIKDKEKKLGIMSELLDIEAKIKAFRIPIGSKSNSDTLATLVTKKEELQSQLTPVYKVGEINPYKKKSYDWFCAKIAGIPFYDPSKETIPFDDEIFKRCIERGVVYEIWEGGAIKYFEIKYSFIFGLKANSQIYDRRLKTAKAKRMIENK